MPIELAAHEVTFLKALAASGERGRTISGPKPSAGMDRIVEAGYVTKRQMSLDTIFYVITESGRAALAEAKPTKSEPEPAP